jgi:hypothetical protein
MGPERLAWSKEGQAPYDQDDKWRANFIKSRRMRLASLDLSSGTGDTVNQQRTCLLYVGKNTHLHRCEATRTF